MGPNFRNPWIIGLTRILPFSILTESVRIEKGAEEEEREGNCTIPLAQNTSLKLEIDWITYTPIQSLLK